MSKQENSFMAQYFSEPAKLSDTAADEKLGVQKNLHPNPDVDGTMISVDARCAKYILGSK